MHRGRLRPPDGDSGHCKRPVTAPDGSEAVSSRVVTEMLQKRHSGTCQMSRLVSCGSPLGPFGLRTPGGANATAWVRSTVARTRALNYRPARDAPFKAAL
jgi:hypothetical protein